MSSLFAYYSRPPPPLYRCARAIRRLSLVVLIGLVIFLVTVTYSAVAVARSGAPSGGYTAGFASNGTVAVTGAFQLNNSGLYPITGFSLGMRILNASSTFLGRVEAGPVIVPPRSTDVIPIAVYLPISARGPAASLLVQDQYLSIALWANATYAYLIPVSVHLNQTRYWGAPFSGLGVEVGTPSTGGGAVSAPVTISFTNHASFDEAGTMEVTVTSARGASCGQGAFTVSAPPGDYFYQQQDVTLATGCSIAGGTASVTYVGDGATIPLPPEALP